MTNTHHQQPTTRDYPSLASVVSLGCAKNLVDSEIMVSQLITAGYQMTSEPAEADLILVNTCGFLESAVKEAIDTILRLATHKDSGKCHCLIVAGCMVQRYGKKLARLIPEIDILLGTSHYSDLGRILLSWKRSAHKTLWISTPTSIQTSAVSRVRSTGPYSAYVKIAEGCSNSCAFCLIPHLRGRYRSRTIADVLQEATRLGSEGVKEINMIAQDTTAFGSDYGETDALMHLIQRMDKINELEWIRILYAYPNRISDGLLHSIAQCQKVVPYLDIPIQHCVPSILRSMGREGAEQGYIEALIDKIRYHVPDITLRTSIIVGYPGETERDFQELLEFIWRTSFDHVGVFAFSPEPGTRAAKLPDQVDEKIRLKRRHTLLRLQRKISRKRLKRHIGKVFPLLVEGFHPETDMLLAGRLPIQAPEVDGMVFITDGVGYPGTIMPARITASHDYDLEATLSLEDMPKSQDMSPAHLF